MTNIFFVEIASPPIQVNEVCVASQEAATLTFQYQVSSHSYSFKYECLPLLLRSHKSWCNWGIRVAL